MLAFAVREALREAVAAFGPDGASVELASPATPEAVFWAAERARRAAPDHVVEGLPGAVPDRPDPARRPSTRGPSRPPAQRGGPDVHWLGAVERLREQRRPGSSSRSPTSAGTRPATPAPRWSSRPTPTWGSVGGGNLEETALARARALLADGADAPEQLPSSASPTRPAPSTAASAAAAR